MAKVILGIDPDSDKHGIAIYIDGHLSSLKMLNTIELYRYLSDFHKQDDITIHLEDVKRTKAIYKGRFNQKDNERTKAMKAQNVGMNKQAQTCIEQMAEAMRVKVILHRPSKMWKDAQSGKKVFEKLTGWTGKSNPDTRSGAHFGYLGVTGRY